MKKNLHLFFCIFLTFNFGVFAKTSETPDWVDGWRQIYPDSMYIAQLGKSTVSAEMAKNEAVNRITEYLKTAVKSTTTSSVVNKTTVEDNNISTSTEKENSKTITLSVDMSINNLEYTDAWYQKKTKTYYVLAFVSRDKAWAAYKPAVDDAKKEFYNLYEKAVTETEPLLSCIYYQSAKVNSENFIQTLDFAHLLQPSIDMDYDKDRTIVAEISGIIKNKILSCSMLVVVKDDYNNIIKSSVMNSFSDLGFLIQERDAIYSVNVVVSPNEEIQKFGNREMYIITPSIEVSIVGQTGTSVYSFAYATTVQSKNFSLEKAKAASFPGLAEPLQKELTTDFREKIGIDRFSF